MGRYAKVIREQYRTRRSIPLSELWLECEVLPKDWEWMKGVMRYLWSVDYRLSG